MRRLVRRVRPHVTIWYHQHMRLVDLGSGAEPALVRAYARRVGLPARHIGFLPGVATRWQNARFPGTNAFVVELPAGRLSRAGGDVATRARRSRWDACARGRRGAAPAVRQWRIPFGSAAQAPDAPLCAPPLRYRRLPAARPARDRAAPLGHRHGGSGVQHVRSQPSRPRAWRATRRLRALRGRPPGAIFQLVSRRLMCRHTVGLNYTSFGIEHVGPHDAGVFARRRQLRASLASCAGCRTATDPHARCDRPQREPGQPVPPRAGGAAASARHTATSRAGSRGATARCWS